ncbi:hypothetical protein SAMN06298216_1471 [Spirosomataceae bacterium TFI 002]|nr:hypothetical protein SAMN06298216_1471 [Spirosomataceae bacterium TFI 002]
MEITMIVILAILVLPVAFLVINQSVKDFYGKAENESYRSYDKYDIRQKYNDLSRLARK